MNKHRHAILFLITILVISVAVVWKSQRTRSPEDVHYHAGFIVYADGKKQDFSDVQYMHIEPCADEGQEEESPEHEQIEKAHLHDGVGDVVHVHRNGAVWGDLFTNIKYEFTGEIQGYVNGEKIDAILDTPIIPYESILIVAGDSNGVNLRETVSREHIVEVEGRSETCGS